MLPPDSAADPAIFTRPARERLPEWAWDYTSALDERMGLVVGELGANRCVGRAPVEGNTQPHGIWHGGASAVLVETLASLAASAWAQQSGKAAVGVDLSVTHHRAVRTGHVTGYATALHQGRTVATYQVHLYDDASRLIGTGRLTCQLVAARPPG